MRSALVRSAAFAAAMAIAATGLVACGSSDSDSATTDTGSSTAAASTTAGESTSTTTTGGIPASLTTPPTKIPETQPLKEAPAKKTVIQVACPLPACQAQTVGWKDGAAALGWDYKKINYDLSAPNTAVQQAVDLSPDFITIQGVPLAATKSAVANAQKKGIPVYVSGTSDKTDAAAGYYSVAGSAPAVATADELAEWVTADSGGKAKVVGVGLPDYSQQVVSLATMGSGIKKCADCTWDTLPMSPDQLAKGAAPGLIVAYLQTHPDTDYIYLALADALTGVPEALKSAGLSDKVKIVIDLAGNTASTKAVIDGQASALAMFPVGYLGWSVIDSMARESEGMPDQEAEKAAGYPTYVLDSAEAAEALGPEGIWDGPEGYQDQFKALWKVG